MHERNEGLRLFCVFRVHVILTTDFQDLTDFHHERKRANQIHQINPFLFSFTNTECTKEAKVFFAEAQQATRVIELTPM